MSDESKSWLLKLCTLPVIGEWASTIVALFPFLLYGLFLGITDSEVDLGPWTLLFLFIIMVPWLLILERTQGVRMNTPYIPIKILWIMPILIIFAISEIVGA